MEARHGATSHITKGLNMNDTTDVNYESFLITIITDAPTIEELKILARPFWEIDAAKINDYIEATIVEFCNTYGTGAFTVRIVPINT